MPGRFFEEFTVGEAIEHPTRLTVAETSRTTPETRRTGTGAGDRRSGGRRVEPEPRHLEGAPNVEASDQDDEQVPTVGRTVLAKGQVGKQ